MKARGFFVTGTDTGVGKTLAACALVHALRREGLSVAPMKPVAAGASVRGGLTVNEDTEALMQAAGLAPEWASAVTPILLREPIAPHIAAALERRPITLAPIEAAFERLAGAFDCVVVEGVGGFCVPLDDERDTVDLARALRLPVILVVGLRLGCLNHALLTAQAIDRAGLPFAGWIANGITAGMPYRDENVEALKRRLRAPLLGTIPRMAAPDARAAAGALDVRPLVSALQ